MRSRTALISLLVIGAVVAAGCNGAGNSGTTTAPTREPATAVAAPALVADVAVPQRFYRLSLPAGWTSTLGAKATDVDTFSGPGGSLTVEFIPIPTGTAQDAWAETYQAAQVGDFPAGCYIGAANPSENARIGSERGLLFNLSCLPGWMLLTAYGDRGYDLRFTSASGADPTHGKQLFLAILASFSFNVAPAS